MKIKVGNVKHGDKGEYMGRAGYGKQGSVLGNPFRVGRDGTQGECVGLFDTWVTKQIAIGNPAIVAEFQRLGKIAESEEGLTLVCWCTPLPCHCDVIKRIILAHYA